MGMKEILEFVKIEHTLFSLPFVLIGYILAHNQFVYDISSSKYGVEKRGILNAAVGARGLAIALNRIIDNTEKTNKNTDSR